MIIVQFIKVGLRLRNLIGDFGDDHAWCGEQFLAEHFGRLHMQGVMDFFAGNKMWDHNGDRLVGLPVGKNFIDVTQQGFQKEAVRRIQNDETGPASPPFPFLADLFRILRFQRDVDRGNVVR